MAFWKQTPSMTEPTNVNKDDFNTLSERLTRTEKRIVDLEGRMLNVEGDADNFRNKVLRKIQRRNQEEAETIEERPRQVGSPMRR